MKDERKVIMKEIKKTKLDANGTNSQKKRYDVMSILSLCTGILAIILGAKSNPNTLWCVMVAVVAIVGVAMAFTGGIKVKSTGSKVRGMATAGLILNLVMITGIIFYMSAKVLGDPAQFGMDALTSVQKVLMIAIYLVTAALCVLIIIGHAKITKK